MHVSSSFRDDGFVTASNNGALIKWNKKCNIVKQIKPYSNRPMIKLVNGELVAIAEKGPLMIFDNQLEIVKQFTGTDKKPRCIDGTNQFIAFGDFGGAVRFYARHGSSEPTVNKTRNLKLKLKNFDFRFINTIKAFSIVSTPFQLPATWWPVHLMTIKSKCFQ